MATIILTSLAVILFLGSFFMKRRFGLLALALAAGYLISTQVGFISELLAEYMIINLSDAQEVFITLLCIFLPAVCMLFVGPTYHKKWQNLVGSLLFVLLGITLMIDPLYEALVFDGPALEVLAGIEAISGYVIVGCLLLAIGDLFLTRFPSRKH